MDPNFIRIGKFLDFSLGVQMSMKTEQVSCKIEILLDVLRVVQCGIHILFIYLDVIDPRMSIIVKICATFFVNVTSLSNDFSLMRVIELPNWSLESSFLFFFSFGSFLVRRVGMSKPRNKL